MKSALSTLLALCLTPAISNALDVDSLKSVLGSVTVDFNSNGDVDRAVLVENNGEADLYIFLDSQLALEKKAVSFSGAMWGQMAELGLNSKNSLLIKSMNDAIGRNRWEQTLTVVYRNDLFVIAGITYSERDTLDPQAGGNCDLNLLTGKGTRNGRPVTFNAKPIPLADWTSDLLPAECTF